MRYFVTGATGGLGTAFTAHARAAGDDVTALVREPATPRAAHLQGLGATLAHGHIGDPATMADAARGAEVVVHAAGASTAPEGLSPAAARDALAWLHVAGTENVIRAAQLAGCRRVVVISTADVTLHHGARVNWNEGRALPKPPVGAVAQTKLLAEELALAMATPSLEVTVLRPAWLWGAGETRNRARITALAARGGLRLVGSGKALVQTAHLSNVVSAIVAAGEETAAAGRAYTITDDVLETQRSFFTAYAAALGLAPPRTGLPRGLAYALARLSPDLAHGYAPEEVLRWGFDASLTVTRARSELAWAPAPDRDALFRALATTRNSSPIHR